MEEREALRPARRPNDERRLDFLRAIVVVTERFARDFDFLAITYLYSGFDEFHFFLAIYPRIVMVFPRASLYKDTLEVSV